MAFSSLIDRFCLLDTHNENPHCKGTTFQTLRITNFKNYLLQWSLAACEVVFP